MVDTEMVSPKRILVLTANPLSTERLRLDQEVRNIKEAIKQSKYRENLQIEDEWAVTPRDLLRSIQENRPTILHFSGHGSSQGLTLQNESGKAKLISKDAIAHTFQTFAHLGIECVVLNACYSEAQATEIVKYVPHVVGMREEMGDQSAIKFAESFYDSVGAGQPYKTAFEAAKTRLMLENSAYTDTVQFKTQVRRNRVPEIWLHGWYPYKPSGSISEEEPPTPDEVLDWTSFYSKEPWKIPSSETWQRELFPQLKALRQKIDNDYTGRALEIRSTLSLPVALAVGYMFPETAGYVLQVVQRQDCWRTDAIPAEVNLAIKYQDGSKGQNLLASIAITAPNQGGTEKFKQQAKQHFDSVIYLEPETGTGSRIIRSDAEALAYAISAKDLLRQFKGTDKDTSVHLLLLAPAGFAFFLGHYLSRLGTVIPYEWDDKQSTYHPAFQLEAI